MDEALQELVRRRAGFRCEYCRFPLPPFHIEHILARKHGGGTTESNLALSCIRCNFHKGPNIAGIDPESGAMTRLFNPRLDEWPAHFGWQGARLIGLTPVGRATVAVLEMNHPLRAEARELLRREGRLRFT